MSTPLDDIVSPPVDGQSSSLLRHSRRSVTCHTTKCHSIIQQSPHLMTARCSRFSPTKLKPVAAEHKFQWLALS
jgi:hypothetical protein